MQAHDPTPVTLVDEELEQRVRGREVADRAVAGERLEPERQPEPPAGGQPENADREHGESHQQVPPVLRARIAARRQMERGDHRADPRSGDQETVSGGPRMEDLLGENRDQDRILKPEPAHHPEQHEQVAKRRLAAHVVEAGEEAREHVRGRLAGSADALETHGEEGREHGQIAGGVQEEAGRLADRRHQAPGERRSDHACGVEDRRVERDGVGQVLGSDHLDDEGLTHRDVEGADRPEAARDEHDGGHAHGPRRDEHAEGQCEQHRQRLGEDDQPLAVDAVGHHARGGREAEDRKVAGERDQAEGEAGAREPVHEPALRHALHPRPDQRHALAGDEQAKVPMPERRKAVDQPAARPGARHRLACRFGEHAAPL